MNEKIKKLESVLKKLEALYSEAHAVCEDSAHSISVAEDTITTSIRYMKGTDYEWRRKNRKKKLDE